MEFEYDRYKSNANLKKHGFSLEEAKALWMVQGLEVPARTVDEARVMRIGQIGDKFYSCVYTLRKNKIRLISARRSRAEEERFYKEWIRHEEDK